MGRRLLGEEPGFSLGHPAEDTNGAKMLSGHAFKHAHHAEHGVARSDEGESSEFSFGAKGGDLRGGDTQFGAVEHQVGSRQVNQAIQGSRTGWVVTQRAKVSGHFGKSEGTGADGTNYPGRIDTEVTGMTKLPLQRTE